MQQYPVMGFKNGSLKDFVACWSAMYGSPPVEKLYSDRINKKQFDADDIVQLYVWKNQSVLSELKGKSVENNIVAKLDVINQLKQSYNEEIFQTNFKDMTAVWKIFLKHIISPNQFPIFDQHVFRAYCYLAKGEVKEIDAVLTEAIPNTHKERAKESLYDLEYVPFARQFVREDIPSKKVDEALVTFGKFLKSEYSTALLQSSKI